MSFALTADEIPAGSKVDCGLMSTQKKDPGSDQLSNAPWKSGVKISPISAKDLIRQFHSTLVGSLEEFNELNTRVERGE